MANGMGKETRDVRKCVSEAEEMIKVSQFVT